MVYHKIYCLMKNVALVGCGYWGSKLKRYIPECFNLKYICNSRTDLSTIWKDIDAVIIATPMKTHYEVIREVLCNGKHVFSEKPITLDEAEAQDLKRIASERKLKIAVNYIWTFSKGIQKMVDIIKSERIGKIEYIEMNVKHLGRFLEYNVFWLLASHYLSVLGMFADLGQLKFQTRNCLYNGDICTTGSILFSRCNLLGCINVSTNYPGKDLRTTIYGTKGTIQFDPLNREKTIEVTLYNRQFAKLPPDLTEEYEFFSYDESSNLRWAMEYFRDVLNEKARPNLKTAILITSIIQHLEER